MSTTRSSWKLARLIRPFESFFRLEASSGILLLLAAALALAWANSPLAPQYFHLWELRYRVGLGDIALTKTLHHWINDGLMAVFFFVVGLEIKREVLVGELAVPRRAALAVAAALGGMVVPALVYAVLNAGGPGSAGWGIAMATDIAFALGVLALLGSRVPLALKVFVTAVAIVDDLGAVLVIAFFYTAQLSWLALLIAGALLVVLMLLNRAGIRAILPYAFLGVFVWMAVLESGVHATIAGVLVAMTIPATAGPAAAPGTQAPLSRLEHALHPWVAFLIMPVFALANAGVAIGGDPVAVLTTPVTLGVIMGLFVGKQIGVLGAAWLAVRLGLALLPERVRWGQMWGVSLLCGIGFTMSLFIAALAFEEGLLLDQAKVGIIAASLLAGAAGALVLIRASRVPVPADAESR
ncbi:MAG TPA: Na+/H+ antiporter NhaA [Longimicrobiales bacterium]|nr:Na+/H+ antiporter NhaA [Longimicrobiales bacterium]